MITKFSKTQLSTPTFDLEIFATKMLHILFCAWNVNFYLNNFSN